METSKESLLALLKKECRLYSSISVSEQQQKRDKKCFINGLMTACRVVGISFEELNYDSRIDASTYKVQRHR